MDFIIVDVLRFCFGDMSHPASSSDSPPNPEEKPCPCNKHRPSRSILIECGNKKCKFRWWHATCAGFLKPNLNQPNLKEIGVWHCPSCVIMNFEPVDKDNITTGAVKSLQDNIDAFKSSIQNEIKAISLGVENQLKSFKKSIMSGYESCEKSNSKVSESITSYASVLSQNVVKQTETAEVVVELRRMCKLSAMLLKV